MDQAEYITFLSFLKKVPDHRRAQGKQYEWEFLLTIIATGLASGQKTAWAVGRWANEHDQAILQELKAEQMPSPWTIYRALRYLDIEALEAQVAAYGQALDTEGDEEEGEEETTEEGPAADDQMWQGQAADGKEIRGTNAHGVKTRLLSLVRHERGTILGQQRIPSGAGELSTLPALLAGRDLSGTVTTLDALFTHKEIAQQILHQGGDYFLSVKENQPSLYEAIDTLFQSPPLPGEQRWQHTSHDTGHGRIEKRTIVSSELLNEYLDWPGVEQVVQRTCVRIKKKTGERSQETKYAITSLGHERATAEQLGLLWRGHWTIENRAHYVRDETLGEDRCQAHKGHTAQALAALRNGILAAFRHEGWTSIADALRHYSAPQRSLRLIGAIVA